jgi:hypothetical protein
MVRRSPKKASKKKKSHLTRDFWLLGLSVLAAFIMVRVGVVDRLLNASQELYLVGAFISGIFFTSVITISPASVALGEISQHLPVLLVASAAALGAVVGDLFLFLLIKDTLVQDVSTLLSSSQRQKLKHIFSKGMFKSLTPFVGALIIASPLPDELGLAMLGLSKMRYAIFIPISFCMNFVGVLLVAGIAQLIGG